MAVGVNYPAFSYIVSITNELTPTVTMSADHDFTVGEIVAFRAGKPFGMPEINNRRARVKSITSDTIVIVIDTTNWGIFSLASENDPGTTPPVCLPSATGVTDNKEVPGMNIQDAFDVRRG